MPSGISIGWWRNAMFIAIAGALLILAGAILSQSRIVLVQAYARLLLICGVVFIALSLMVGCASSTLGKGLNVAVGVSATADLVTTRAAITDGRGREANPLLGQHAWQQGLLKVGGVGVVIGAAYLVEVKGRPVLAHLLRAGVAAFYTAVALHNASVVSQ